MKSTVKFSRLVLLSYLGASAMCLGMISGVNAQTAAPFTFFNNMTWTNGALLTGKGMMPSTVIYDYWGLTCSTTGCSNVPAEADFQSKVQYVSGTYDNGRLVIVLDFENMEVDNATSTAQANQEIAQFRQFVSWIKAIYPNALVGAYDYDWNSTNNSLRAQLYTAGGFDFFVPTMYQRWSTYAQWQTNLTNAITNDTAINAMNGTSKPIYPYISPYSNDANTADAFLSESEWDSELSALQSSVRGAILWGSPASTAYMSTWYWVVDTLTMMSPQVNTTELYNLVVAGTDLCLNALGNTSVSGTPVEQFACGTSSYNQQWQLQNVGTTGYYYLTPNLGSSNQVLSVAGSGTTSGSLVELDTNTSASSQQWAVVSEGNGAYEIVGVGSDLCLDVQPSTPQTAVQAALGLCNQSTGQLFNLNAGTLTAAPSTADAYTQDGTSTNTNFGGYSYMVVEGEGTGYDRDSYMKFDLSGVSGAIKQAMVYVVPSGTTGTSVDQAYAITSNSWTETRITWSNAPAMGTQLASWTVPAVGTLIGFDATQAAQSAQSASNPLSIGLASANGTNWVTYGTRHATSNYQPMVVANTVHGTSIIDVADTYIQDGTGASTNYGSHGYMATDAAGTSYDRVSYVKFDLSGVSGTIARATVVLTPSSVATSNITNQAALVTDNTWTESGITWNNAPTASTVLATWNAPTSLAAVIFDITNAAVNAQSNGNLLSLAISSLTNGNSYVNYYTKENGTVFYSPTIYIVTK